MALSTSVNATMLVPSRVAIMLDEDGMAPRWIGRVSAKTGTPIIGLSLAIPLWAKRTMAILSMIAMGVLIARQIRHDVQSSGAGLTTIELAALWSLLGAILYVANRRTPRRIEHAKQP